jgi:hypothetical protein
MVEYTHLGWLIYFVEMASLVSQGWFLAYVIHYELYKGEPDYITFLIITRFCVLHAYVLTCLHDFWPDTAMKVVQPVSFGSVF